MKEKTVNLYGIRQKVILCHTDITKNNIIMTAIDEDDEKVLDKYNEDTNENKSFPFIKNVGKINPKVDIYLYGEVNLNDKNDIDIIKDLNLINDKGAWIYSTFDYEKGNFTTDTKIPKQYTTFDALKWFMFNYVLLGKPKRIIVYKSIKK